MKTLEEFERYGLQFRLKNGGRDIGVRPKGLVNHQVKNQLLAVKPDLIAALVDRGCGVGCQLEREIPWYFKFPGCGCSALARKLDDMGVTHCASHPEDAIDILVQQSSRHPLLRLWSQEKRRRQAEVWVLAAIESAAKATGINVLRSDQKSALECTVAWPYWQQEAVSDELRYSIRSVVKNVSGVKNIVLIGDCPDWYQGDFIPCPKLTVDEEFEQYGSRSWHRQLDAVRKLRKAIDCDLVSEEFLWMYDDTFIVQPITMDDLSVPRSSGNLKVPSTRNISVWRQCRNRSANLLRQFGMDAKNYSTHHPTLYRKSQLTQTLDMFDADRQGVVAESLYLNQWGEGNESTGGVFQYTSTPQPGWNIPPSVVVVNVGEFNQHVFRQLRNRLPDPTSHELPIKPPASVPDSASSISIVTTLFDLSKTRQRNWQTVHASISPLIKEGLIDEWIVVESGCRYGAMGDTTRIQVDEFHSRARMRNIGWTRSRGGIILFLDADIVMSIADWREAIEQCREFDAFSPYNSVCLLSKNQTSARRLDFEQGLDAQIPNAKRSFNFAGGACFVKRSVLRQCGGWDEAFKLWGFEDTALGKLLQNFNCGKGRSLGYHLWHEVDPKKKEGLAKNRAIFSQNYSGWSPSLPLESRKADRSAEVVREDPSIGKLINDLVAVTSLSTSADKRDWQLHCMNTWRKLGLTIVCLQHDEHLPYLQDFDNVEFERVDKLQCHANCTDPDIGRVLIFQYARYAKKINKPVILINSDIEIYQTRQRFVEQWVETPDRTLEFGVRWNYDGDIVNAQREQWGIDAFRFTPEMSDMLPNLSFGIGLPVWDYWIPYHFHSLGFVLHTNQDRTMFHRRHTINWSREDNRKGSATMLRECGVSKAHMDSWIQTIR